MNIEYKIEKVDVLDGFTAPIARGKFRIIDEDILLIEHRANSGGWGKGPMPKGKYKIISVTDQTGEAFTLNGVGWFALLEPQFSTNRTYLGIHPDGNVEGSLGCLAIPFVGPRVSIFIRDTIKENLPIELEVS